MKKLLVIDDDATHRLIRRNWVETLCPGRFEVIEAGNAEAGFEMTVKESPACVLLDFVMPGEDGLQALHRMRHDIPGCPPVILLTCALTEELSRNALALGAAACFDKATVDGAGLVEAIIAAVERGTA